MHYLSFLYPLLLASSAFVGTVGGVRKPANSVLLSNVQSLTLRKDVKTSHRRVPAIPQLKCIGGNAKSLYEVDVMRCKNAGSDYDDDNIQWTCTASLPEEFKLGSTDVICEGYDSPNDPYILKGSCGVEYRLVLTDKGEEKHGKGGWFNGPGKGTGESGRTGETVVSALFWIIFIGVALWIVFSACIVRGGDARRPDTWRPGWGGGYGGGGPGDDPPPPYDWRPQPKPSSSSRSDQQWRPGFWTGALGGAAAGYMAGNRGNRQDYNRTTPSNQRGGSWWNNGEGSSTRSGSSSSSNSASSTRYESTGFGSTSRR
ncbi:hypothetical protein AOQ84DRAFT_384483 [Glonium stellatum]|uniref:Store-operated calcium entry-associated regulatory factor n=1 Tax=Glonium stellatum TaxID=574774 RepID=A0A8E2FD61_9PEZI|nr:hypothetical protein AOQ84DRAFT_384483 [Glonium stellatum]